MSKQKERFEAMRAEATEKILLSAAKLFAHKTFGKTTMQDIADDAGLSKGLAYRYFATKEEIMSRLIEISIPGLDRMAELFQQEGNKKEVIINATTFLLNNLQEDPSSTDGLLLLSQIDSFSDQELSFSDGRNVFGLFDSTEVKMARRDLNVMNLDGVQQTPSFLCYLIIYSLTFV